MSVLHLFIIAFDPALACMVQIGPGSRSLRLDRLQAVLRTPALLGVVLSNPLFLHIEKGMPQQMISFTSRWCWCLSSDCPRTACLKVAGLLKAGVPPRCQDPQAMNLKQTKRLGLQHPSPEPLA